jgi:hypothetical protein
MILVFMRRPYGTQENERALGRKVSRAKSAPRSYGARILFTRSTDNNCKTCYPIG